MEQVLKPENILSTAGFEPVSSDSESEGVGTKGLQSRSQMIIPEIRDFFRNFPGSREFPGFIKNYFY